MYITMRIVVLCNHMHPDMLSYVVCYGMVEYYVFCTHLYTLCNTVYTVIAYYGVY